MGWFRNKPDPISDRARALQQEISALESEIHKLDSQLQRNPDQPRLRSTALPQKGGGSTGPDSTGSLPRREEPMFEDLGQGRLKARAEDSSTREHYNELGVRKYDLPALLRRLKSHLRGPSASNPKLVSYLAAGGIQGLRPLRYEKRVARNRFIALVAILFLVLLGLIAAFSHH